MIKGIIFDFNRTLYMPEINKIPEATIKLLEQLKEQNIILALISKWEPNRSELIKEIAKFFSEIKIVADKSKQDFIEILKNLKLKEDKVIIVGDRIKKEIKIAKELGIKTAWFRQGKFKDETPESEDEKPDYTITNLSELIKIIKKESNLFKRKTNDNKVTKMQYQKPKGTRDFYPGEKRARHVLFDSFRSIAAKYGYGEIESPAFEYLELLTAKSGEEIKKEIFVMEQRSSEQLGLKFDLTIPAARLFIQKQKELPKPVKWFYVDKMWRYERPQAGRLREFYQMGVELFGSDKAEADAEVISLAIDFLLNLGLKKEQFIVKINNRKLLEGLLKRLKISNISETIRVIDKKNKISEADFTAELKKLKLTSQQIQNIKQMLKTNNPNDLKKLKFFAQEAELGLKELNAVIYALKLFRKERYIQFDLSAARGLDYYTGCVFECFDSKQAMRSIFAGGRYDNLIENFGGEKTPATGFAIGDATLQLLLEENGLWEIKPQPIDYYIIVISENAKEQAFELCQRLRLKYAADIDLTGRSIKNQLDYANKLGAQKVIFLGDSEIKSQKATIKDMRTGKEEKIPFTKL